MSRYTPKQRRILEFIAEYQAAEGVSPTLEEIGQNFGIHRVTVFQHVRALEGRGALRRSPQLARSIEILDPEFHPERGVRIVGSIAAGAPIEALEDVDRLEPTDLFPSGEDHYGLRVRGDSMIEDGIHDGDLVICRRTSNARPGEIVVAILEDNEATLKRYRPLPDGRVQLEPANARLRPFVVDQCEIQGVVSSVIRQL